MKATGIVRRIDDLGRVVIPKEIRRTMRIREGDPLEIFTNNDGGVVFKKYSLMGGLGDFSAQLCDSLHKATGRMVTITDRDVCLSVAGASRKEITGKNISPALSQRSGQSTDRRRHCRGDLLRSISPRAHAGSRNPRHAYQSGNRNHCL